jgi:hypothetical protein
MNTEFSFFAFLLVRGDMDSVQTKSTREKPTGKF